MNAVITQNTEIFTHSKNVSNKPTSHIGELLAKARQSKEIDVTTIAQKLHLSVATIQALERDQFDGMRGVFVRGYIKKYARLVELNEGDLPLLSEPEPVLPLARPSDYSYELQREIRSNHIMVQIVTWLIVLGIISLFGLWWQGQLEWENTMLFPTAIQTDSQPVESTNNSNHAISTLKLPPQSDSASNLSKPQILSNPTPPNSSIPVTSPQVETILTTPPLSPSPIQPEPTTTPVQPPVPVLPLPTATQPGQAIAGGIELTATTVPPTPPVDTAPQREIVLKILGTSKIEVTDATEKFKLSGKVSKGEKYTFTGKPPYNIVLEKVSAVRLTIDGKPFKIKSRSRKGGANFILDPNKLEP